MLNVITANFSRAKETTTYALWQWDYGQILQITGLELPDPYEVHFSNSQYKGEAKTQIGIADGVTIPDEYMTTGDDVYAFIYLHEGDADGETEYKIHIPVRKRPQPTDGEVTPQEQTAISQAIALLRTATDDAQASAEDTAQSAQEAASVVDTAQGYADTASQAAQDAQGSVDAVQQSASQASQSAQSAAQDATYANASKNTATQAAQRAEDALQAVQALNYEITVSGTKLIIAERGE